MAPRFGSMGSMNARAFAALQRAGDGRLAATRLIHTSPLGALDFFMALDYIRSAAGRVRGALISPGPIRSARELFLSGAVASGTWRPPYVCRDPARSYGRSNGSAALLLVSGQW